MRRSLAMRVIAPYISVNHNETIVSDEVELNAEGMEEVIAPSGSIDVETQKLRRERREENALQLALSFYQC
jgi:hypothetical protein